MVDLLTLINSPSKKPKIKQIISVRAKGRVNYCPVTHPVTEAANERASAGARQPMGGQDGSHVICSEANKRSGMCIKVEFSGENEFQPGKFGNNVISLQIAYSDISPVRPFTGFI